MSKSIIACKDCKFYESIYCKHSKAIHSESVNVYNGVVTANYFTIFQMRQIEAIPDSYKYPDQQLCGIDGKFFELNTEKIIERAHKEELKLLELKSKFVWYKPSTWFN